MHRLDIIDIFRFRPKGLSEDIELVDFGEEDVGVEMHDTAGVPRTTS